MLYEVAVVCKPTPAEAEDGKLEEIVKDVFRKVAVNEKSASISTISDLQKEGILEQYDIERIEVLVRPF